MEALHARLGAVEAHRELARRDPEAAAALHPNDTRRVIRALELHSVGKTLTPDRDRLWSKTTRLSSLIVGLDVERDLLARRIAERTAAMWERGGPDEARAALTVDGLSDQARQLIGLRETELGLERDEWIESVEARTRQYARRQRTWMRKIPGMQPLDGSRPAAYLAAELLVGLRAG
jgi:tRNA dimethylallyltransferase